MTPNAHIELMLGVMARQDVTPERLAWAATFDNAKILGRVVSNSKTPTPLIREIRDRGRPRRTHLGASAGVRG